MGALVSAGAVLAIEAPYPPISFRRDKRLTFETGNITYCVAGLNPQCELALSRYIVAWKLCANMKASDVTDTLELALKVSGCISATVRQKPRLLSDNGSSYISHDLAKWLEHQGIGHVRGTPNHPQTQGKIERWHQTLKNRILLENYYLPGALEEAVQAFVEYYNHSRYHESLANLTPADVYFGRDQIILSERRRIKEETLKQRRLLNQKQAA